MQNLKFLFLISLFLFHSTVFSASKGIFKITTAANLETTYQAVYKELEAKNFWVVFEVNIGENISRFKDKWGDTYNQNKLEGIKNMVVCNGWYANQVSNADPDLLSLCPLRISVIHKKGKSTVLFARPTLAAAGSPGLAVVKEIEDIVIDAINKAISNL